MNAEELKTKTDRELLEHIVKKQVDTDRRLQEGDVEIGMCMNAIQTLCKIQGAHDAADELAAYIRDKRAKLAGNGATDFHDEPTNPDIK